MKLVMTLLVRNEADIIEANLDYHLAQGVDFVIVTDHGSGDGTGELLRRYEQTGLVTVLHDEGEGHDQSMRVTRMAQLALTEHCADWVIHNDADEFWWPLAGSLRDVFASIPAEYGQIEVQRRNFLPRPDGVDPFYSRLVYRDRASINPSGEPLEPKVAHRAHPDVVVAAGNHSISGAELRPVPVGELLEIFHFPMRSYDQFERKVIQTGIGYEKLEDRPPAVGRDQLKLLQVYREHALRQYYDALVDETARSSLEDGRIVLDRRLAEFMRTLPKRAPQANRPDGPPTRSFLATALGAFLELDSARQALAREQADLTTTGEALGRAQVELAQAQAQAATLGQQVQLLQAELASTGEALRLLRGSHLVRWTVPLRRIWYRVK
ncbi:MAG: glycosyltransferase family 2 protein [Solirubrobacteraceae bacterium]